MSDELYCPHCMTSLEKRSTTLYCSRCCCYYSIIDGIPSFLPPDRCPEGFDENVFELLFSVEEKHFWHRGRKEIILDVLKRHVSGLAKARILEIGCGTGNIMAYFQEHGLDIAGSDVFLKALQFCRRRTGAACLYQADITALPFKENFNIVGLFDVLEHIQEDENALEQALKTLKPGGTLIITVPAYQWLWSNFDKHSHHKRRYSKQELVLKLKKTGFQVRMITFYMNLLFPVLAFIRLWSKLTCTSKSAETEMSSFVELKVVPLLNLLLLAVMRFERFLLRFFCLPFGVSLLVVADKPGNESYSICKDRSADEN